MGFIPMVFLPDAGAECKHFLGPWETLAQCVKGQDPSSEIVRRVVVSSYRRVVVVLFCVVVLFTTTARRHDVVAVNYIITRTPPAAAKDKELFRKPSL